MHNNDTHTGHVTKVIKVSAVVLHTHIYTHTHFKAAFTLIRVTNRYLSKYGLFVRTSEDHTSGAFMVA